MLRAAIVAIAFGVTGLWSVSADACSCVVPGLPCEAVWRSDVIFSGRVVALESSAPGSGARGVEFAVIETFRGPDARTVVVGSGGGCSYSFKIQPRAAENVVVPAGERVQLGEFVVPEAITLVTVKGKVLDTEGRRQIANLLLTDDTEGPNVIGPRLTTANDGSFIFSLVPGARYEASATREVGTDVGTRETHMGRAVFEASAAARPLTVVMKPSSR